MTGVSGTSKTEKKYHYYQCVTNRRDKSCNKKTVNKDYIEDVVVQQLREFLTPDNITTIAKEVVDLCERESNNGNAKRLQKLLSENEKATENLLKALESGQAVEIIAERITQKKKEHDELSYQLLVETTQHPIPSVRDIRFFLSQFRKGDINDPKYRQGLVDMLVNKIYLYDDKMTILCNTQDGHFDVDLKEVSSLKGHLVARRRVYKNSPKVRTTSLCGPFQRGRQHILLAAVVVMNLYFIVPKVHGFDESIKQPLLIVLAGHITLTELLQRPDDALLLHDCLLAGSSGESNRLFQCGDIQFQLQESVLGHCCEDSLLDGVHDILCGFPICGQLGLHGGDLHLAAGLGQDFHCAVCDPLYHFVLEDEPLRELGDDLLDVVLPDVLLFAGATSAPVIAGIVVMLIACLAGAGDPHHEGLAIAAVELSRQQIIIVLPVPPPGILLCL